MISKKTKLFVSALAFFNVLCSPMVLASFNGNDHPESDESFGARASELRIRVEEYNHYANDCLGCLIDAATDWVCEKLHVRRRLRVRNDNTEDLTIYLLVEDQPIELGTVGAGSIQTFRLPRDLNCDLYRVGGSLDKRRMDSSVIIEGCWRSKVRFLNNFCGTEAILED